MVLSKALIAVLASNVFWAFRMRQRSALRIPNGSLHGIMCMLLPNFLMAARKTAPFQVRHSKHKSTTFYYLLTAHHTGFLCPATISEDCLTINVWSPRSAFSPSAAPLPAYVFIHGGSFEFGSSGIPFFNASRLASSQDMVVFTFNYRLGVLGFFQCSNFGIKDQIMALQWVRDNAAQFGADPAAVTLAGESAGAFSVFLHLTLPASVGLFSRAVVESHPLRVPMRSPESSAKWSSDWCSKVGCGSGCAAGCVRNASISNVIGAQDETMVYSFDVATMLISWLPCVDGTLIPMQMYESMYVHDGIRSQVPLLMGTNEGEGWMFVSALFPNKSPIPIEFDAILAASFGFKIAERVIDE
jgi:carboxylesterase type B